MDVTYWLIATLTFVLLITALVGAHEYGHFLFARLFKMNVEEFAIGFGRPPWRWMRKKGTDFTFRPVPLGGFVRISGMEPKEDGSEVQTEGGFFSKPPWQRFLVLGAGPLFSILFGVLLIFVTKITFGEPMASPVIEQVLPDMPAEKAGLQKGDRLVAVNGQTITEYWQAQRAIQLRPEEPTEIVIDRAGEILTFTITPILAKDKTPVLGPDGRPTGEMKEQGMVGFSPATTTVSVPPGEAFQFAMSMPGVIGGHILGLFTKPQRMKDEVGGPIAIFTMTAESSKGGIERVLGFCAMLSISIGYLNLLPIPPFDGGQMVIAIAEMLRRGRRLSYRIQTVAMQVGFCFILLLFASVMFMDVSRLIQR
ncbi:MAG: M50 family metallopeptidase [Fimbriimonadaceae bacterium]